MVKLEKLIKQRKGKLTIDDWITAMQSWGIPPDTIAEVSKSEKPGDLYNEIALRQERTAKAPETILYSTLHLPETRSMYFEDTHMIDFDAEIVDIFANVLQNGKKNIVILNQSAFYPTSGGQANDTGKLTI